MFKMCHKYLTLEANPSFVTFSLPGQVVKVQLTCKILGIACVQEEFLLLCTHLASKFISIVTHLRAPLIWAGEALVL